MATRLVYRGHSIVKLGDYGFNSKNVPNPYFFKGFNKVYEMIDYCVNELLSQELE